MPPAVSEARVFSVHGLDSDDKLQEQALVLNVGVSSTDATDRMQREAVVLEDDVLVDLSDVKKTIDNPGAFESLRRNLRTACYAFGGQCVPPRTMPLHDPVSADCIS